MNNHTKRWKKNRVDDKRLVSKEKLDLIKGLYKDDPERYYQARLAKIFSCSREYIRQVLEK